MLQHLFGSRPAQQVTQLSVNELQRQLAANPALQLIDVRSAEEYQHDGHIHGAKLIPLPTLSARLHEIDRDTPVVVICRSGNRSQTAAELLVRHGYTKVSNMHGGMLAWHGYPTL
jgi:rhodanese-related sulfurtransferase